MHSSYRWFAGVIALVVCGAPLAAQTPAAAPKPERAAARTEMISRVNARAFALLDQREAAVARITTRAAAEQRKAANHRRVLKLIGGLPTWRGPLAAKSYGTIEGEGFRVEKITYESLPGFLVTANVYLPTSGKGPYPAVVLTAGHDPSGKIGQYSFGANLARAGIASLAYDPISEGERTQYLDPATGASRLSRVTGEHSHAGVQTILLGEHVSRYFVWDAMRGIDYLASRGDIDANRIGAFGCSGGGTVTAYLAALDDRVKAAASACYITSFRDLLTVGDPQEGEQSIPHFVESGMDLADWVEMAAPKPYAVVSTTEDMFPFSGAKRAVEEARRIYGLYGAADRFAWFTAFYKDFYNLDENLGTRISQEAVTASWNTATGSAPVAAYAVVPSWIEDFRPDVEAVRASGKPALIAHGTADNILPIDATGRPFHAAIAQDPTTEIVIDVENQEVRFAGQTVKGPIRESARDALVHGRWDPIGELLEGLPAVKAATGQLAYFAV